MPIAPLGPSKHTQLNIMEMKVQSHSANSIPGSSCSFHSDHSSFKPLDVSQKGTGEEVEDDAVALEGSKKKKKKKKKKSKKSKKASNLADNIPSFDPEQKSPPGTPILTTTSTIPISPPFSSLSQRNSPRSPAHMPSSDSWPSTLDGPGEPFISLHSRQTTIQVGTAYSKGRLDRPEVSTIMDKVSDVFSNLKRKDKEVEKPPSRADKAAYFATLPKRSNKLMHQLLNTSEGGTLGKAPIKWDKFVQASQLLQAGDANAIFTTHRLVLRLCKTWVSNMCPVLPDPVYALILPSQMIR